VRWSPNPTVGELLHLGGVPLIGTSANRSGEAAARDAEAVARIFGADVDIVVDGGTTAGGAPSTLIDATVTPFRILRAGAVSAEALRAALQNSHPDVAPPPSD